MANLPSPLSYGTVVGTFVQAVADSADPDTNPDALPMIGTVEFTPSVAAILVPTATPPTTVLPQKITKVLDSSGHFQVTLLATDDPDMQPTGWTYSVRFVFTGVIYQAFNIAVPGGQTIDLTLAAPVPASSGTAHWAYQNVQSLTQAEYDAIAPGTPGVLYAITPA